VVVETHPVQYRAPVYRAVEQTYGIPVTVIYGSDFSVAGYCDKEFGASFSWNVDLTTGTNVRFLSRVENGGARSFEEVSTRGLEKMLVDANGSAVLLTGYSPAFNALAFYHAWKTRRPILLRAETSDCASPRNSLKSVLRDQALCRLYSICARVLPIGTYSREHYRRLGVPEEKMILAPYCVNTDHFQCLETDRQRLRQQTRSGLGLGEEDVAVLFSGKLSVRKGVHILSQAVKRLPEPLRSKIVLIFLGSGSEQKELAADCENAPRMRACFPGFRNQTELSPYYHAADLLTLPSIRAETWGLVVNEALHHGLPAVVSQAVGCVPDLIEEGRTGAVAGTGSAESLAGAIARVAELKDDARIRAACRAKVSAFSMAAAAQGIARAWGEATVEGRAHNMMRNSFA
jgi:glycosyltransferase involved in cell wall biosynthesis